MTVSTPHRGAPIAAVFSSVLGVPLLRALSVATMHAIRTEHLRLDILVRLAGALLRPEGRAAEATLSRVTAELTSEFSADGRKAVEHFLAEIGRDQDLLPQLAPAARDALNAATPDRDGVRYGCVVSRAPTPGLRSVIGSARSPYAIATHAVFLALYRLATGGRATMDLEQAQRDALERAFGNVPGARANDGVVPTQSQVWGHVIHASWADHLDVVGHFHHPNHVPPHFDWLRSGSGFTRTEFEHLWADVVEFQLGE